MEINQGKRTNVRYADDETGNTTDDFVKYILTDDEEEKVDKADADDNPLNLHDLQDCFVDNTCMETVFFVMNEKNEPVCFSNEKNAKAYMAATDSNSKIHKVVVDKAAIDLGCFQG